MSKTIKLEDNTYNDLEKIRDKRETFNQVVARLIDVWRILHGMEPLLRGHTAYEQFSEARREK